MTSRPLPPDKLDTARMDDLAQSLGLASPMICLPRSGLDFSRWPVIACDQFTSEPEYWQETAAIVGDAPSTLHMILPELFLDQPGDLPVRDRISKINQVMQRYLTDGTLRTLPPGWILTDRSTPWHPSRKGLIVAIDLECYHYQPGSQMLVRPSEGTVLERIPPRLMIRRDAPLELPHIQLLIDDPEQKVIEPLFTACKEAPPLYATELMQQGGSIRSWSVPAGSRIFGQALFALSQLDSVQRLSLLGAVGDGNHSLATAKAHWETLRTKASPRHPARYALVELVNIHDPGLAFEPIHRVVFDLSPELFLSAAARWFADQDFSFSETDPAAGYRSASDPLPDSKVLSAASGDSAAAVQLIPLLWRRRSWIIQIKKPVHSLTAGSLQAFLDDLVRHGQNRVDYIHGAGAVRRLAEGGALGLLLPAIEKAAFFSIIAREGILPRKTFSMGEAREKRYYFECRRII
jgi:hypothetical protein